MFLFVLLNLASSFLDAQQLDWLVERFGQPMIALGAVLMILSIVLARVKRLSAQTRYDLFASGSWLIWLPYWYPDFRLGSPVFVYLPLYFALLAAASWLFFVKRREEIDQQTLLFLQWLSDSGRFNPVIIAGVVVAGVYFKQHFLLYPSAMTLWVVRQAMASSLEPSQKVL